LQDRKVVVSNRSFREMERERQKEVLQHSLEEGAIVSGIVTNILDFGAFVDIGGVEGLIPLSELSYKRVRHPSEVVRSGDSIRVKVLSIDWKEDRITLSLKSLLENPWQGQMPFAAGDIVEATVDSIKNFGVFARLPDGFSGLIPMSETGLPRGVAADKEFHRGEQLRL
ncbi:MAG: S1 RNA-binding domain-containing protein, partial [Leptospiraceae bacterium]|nr:S1 RNA-binding domain-containing protein [Leptospiraceae bacterium]